MPGIKAAQVFQSCHVVLVTPSYFGDGGSPLARGQTVLSPGNVRACGQALEVPFPRSDDGLVKIIQIKYDFTLRRAVEAKVAQVRITGEDHVVSHGGCRA